MDDTDIDDEVFIEKTTCTRTEQRSRHLSDCIDSIGDNFNIHRHSFSEFGGHESSRSSKSPPGTPDLGYYSPVSSSYICRPLWFRYSTSSSFHCSTSDAVDAGALENASATYNTSPERLDSVRSGASCAKMPVEKYADEYNMTHPRRGRAVILNNDTFPNNLPDRDGSKIDVLNLKNCFESLMFEVTVHHNLCTQKIKNVLESLAEEDHSDADCFVMVVLTHGLHSNLLWSNDYPYDADLLWTTFMPSKCATLAGKPKLFFIQACRGDRLDPGTCLVSQTQTDSGSFGYKIPNHADFLIAFSTTTGMYSFRNAEKGTWFIQSLCEELRRYGTTEDILRIMTKVLRRVALDFESYNIEIPSQHGQKQVPMLHSMLIRNVFFRPKDQ